MLFIVLCVAIYCNTHAQFLDSIKQSLKSKPKLSAGLSTRYSFITGFSAPVVTGYVGVSFKSKIRFGGGFSYLKAPRYDGNYNENQLPFYKHYVFNTTDTVSARLKFFYMMYYVDYVFYNTPKWEFSVPLQAGFGITRYDYTYILQEEAAERKFLFVYLPSVAFEYKLARWLSISSSVGYRFIVHTQKTMRQKFASPVYDLGLSIYYSELFKMAFPNSKLAQRL